MHGSTIQASAPGKLILLGEYAVLEQAPCLVSAVQRKCTVRISPQDDLRFSIESSRNEVPNVDCILTETGDFRFENDLSAEGYKRLRFVLSTLKHVIRQLDYSIKGAAIHINTDGFFHKPSEQKLGLGASAAITVSLLHALMEYAGHSLSAQQLYREAFQIHREAQNGLGSGMDIAASATGGVIKYQMSPENPDGGTIQPVEWPASLQMISIWTGYSASTQNMVQKVRAFRKARPDRYTEIMGPMKRLSEAGCRAFNEQNVESFLEIVSEYVNQEQKLGEASGADIISGVHREIESIIKKAGGSYKPSGAGGGDIGIAFCGGTDACLRVKQAVEESRFDLLDLPLQTGRATAK